ncbi:orotidine-5'-phosphate decarboxylase [Bartonella sp. B35(2025)]
MSKNIPFFDKFKKLSAVYSPLCVGLDPTSEALEAWCGYDNLDALEKYCIEYLNILVGKLAIIKPQLAFFERFGAEGFKVLEKVINICRNNNILILLDAKRSDISTTMYGYAQAYFSMKSKLRVDAITVTPFLGFDTLLPLIDEAAKNGAYVFVVTASSNPEGRYLQNALVNNITLYQYLANDIKKINTELYPEVKPCGAVVGATQANLSDDFYETLSSALLLSPGIGSQGATMEDLYARSVTKNIIPTISRALSSLGNDKDKILSVLSKYKSMSMNLLN